MIEEDIWPLHHIRYHVYKFTIYILLTRHISTIKDCFPLLKYENDNKSFKVKFLSDIQKSIYLFFRKSNNLKHMINANVLVKVSV